MCCRFSSNQKDIKIFFFSSENKHHYHYVRGWRLSSSASRISWCRKFLVGALNSMKLIIVLLQIQTFWVAVTSVLDLSVRERASLNSMSTVSPVNPAGKEVSHLSSGYNMINRKSDTNKTASFSRYLDVEIIYLLYKTLCSEGEVRLTVISGITALFASTLANKAEVIGSKWNFFVRAVLSTALCRAKPR